MGPWIIHIFYMKSNIICLKLIQIEVSNCKVVLTFNVSYYKAICNSLIYHKDRKPLELENLVSDILYRADIQLDYIWYFFSKIILYITSFTNGMQTKRPLSMLSLGPKPISCCLKKIVLPRYDIKH